MGYPYKNLSFMPFFEGIFASFLFVTTKAMLTCSVAETLNNYSEVNFPLYPSHS